MSHGVQAFSFGKIGLTEHQPEKETETDVHRDLEMKKAAAIIVLTILLGGTSLFAQDEDPGIFSDIKTLPKFEDTAKDPDTGSNEEKQKPKPFIFKFGIESMSRTKAISGGSYFYTEFMGRLADGLDLSLKYSASVVPYPYEDNCLFASTVIRLGTYGGNNEVYCAPLFMTNAGRFKTSQSRDFDRHAGGKVCLLSQTTPKDSIHVEFLPITLFYNIDEKKVSYAFEFFSVGFVF